MNKAVSILGTKYNIIEQDETENSKLREANANGLCEVYSKEIVLRKFEQHPCNYKNFDEFRKKVLRHEIIHAFFMESGLTQYMEDEQLVDWLALQFSKIHRAMYDTNCLEKVT